MSKTIEDLQRIVADESRTEEERRQAAEHILKLQTPSQPDQEETDRALIRRVFSAMFGDERKQQEIDDVNMRVCSSCFLIQTKANVTCELCGSTEGWLVPSKARSDPDQAVFINMASTYSIDRLKTALYSGWATTSKRERVARLLFSSRQAKLKPQTIIETASSVEPEPFDVKQIDFAKLLARYDRQIAEITGQQAEAISQ